MLITERVELTEEQRRGLRTTATQLVEMKPYGEPEPKAVGRVGIKGCPFCGEDPEGMAACVAIPLTARTRGQEPIGWFVQCEKCGCEGPYKDTKSEAIEAWNRRPG